MWGMTRNESSAEAAAVMSTEKPSTQTNGVAQVVLPSGQEGYDACQQIITATTMPVHATSKKRSTLFLHTSQLYASRFLLRQKDDVGRHHP